MPKSHIGKTCYVASALPATNDATGFEALTWVKVNGFQSHGSLGMTRDNIDSPNLQTGIRHGLKGAGSGREVPFVFFDVDGDTGQGNLKTLAADAEGLCSVKIVHGSGINQAPVEGDPVEYAQGYIKDIEPREANDSTDAGFTANFKQNAATVVATQPAP